MRSMDLWPQAPDSVEEEELLNCGRLGEPGIGNNVDSCRERMVGMKRAEMPDFEQMRQLDIRTVDKNSLVDLNAVVIDESKSVQERTLSFLRQIKNPYCFRVGDVAVKVNYSPDGPTFEQCFEDLINTAYR